MNYIYLIDDDFHSEGISRHATFEDAKREIDRLSTIPLNTEPNFPPCGHLDTCGRRYEIVRFEVNENNEWLELDRTPIVELRQSGIKWLR